MSITMHDPLYRAIERRQILCLRYRDGQPRMIEPYSYWETPGGRRMIRAYQCSGYSMSGEQEGWKTFNTADIKSCIPTGEVFALPPREGYDPFNAPVGRFFIMIDPPQPEWLTAPPPIEWKRVA